MTTWTSEELNNTINVEEPQIKKLNSCPTPQAPDSTIASEEQPISNLPAGANVISNAEVMTADDMEELNVSSPVDVTIERTE